MSKKQKVQEQVGEAFQIAVCSDCGHHRNKPSRCISKEMFVGRKRPVSNCDIFQSK